MKKKKEKQIFKWVTNRESIYCNLSTSFLYLHHKIPGRLRDAFERITRPVIDHRISRKIASSITMHSHRTKSQKFLLVQTPVILVSTNLPRNQSNRDREKYYKSIDPRPDPESKSPKKKAGPREEPIRVNFSHNNRTFPTTWCTVPLQRKIKRSTGSEDVNVTDSRANPFASRTQALAEKRKQTWRKQRRIRRLNRKIDPRQLLGRFSSPGDCFGATVKYCINVLLHRGSSTVYPPSSLFFLPLFFARVATLGPASRDQFFPVNGVTRGNHRCAGRFRRCWSKRRCNATITAARVHRLSATVLQPFRLGSSRRGS